MCCLDLTEATALRWAPIIAGHILHVRFADQGKHVDVICIYQFSWSYAGDAEALRAKRERIWIRLDKLLSSLPRRNMLIKEKAVTCPALWQARFAAFLNHDSDPVDEEMQMFGNLLGKRDRAGPNNRDSGKGLKGPSRMPSSASSRPGKDQAQNELMTQMG